jgi:hypothetical protein
VKPPTSVAAHQADKTQACTDCHYHNRPVANCSDCHGFPPLYATAFDPTNNKNGQSYAGGAGAHQRHLDALGTAIFDCAICHGPDVGSASWHNHNNGTVIAAEVDIMGQTSWWGSSSPTYIGANSSETLPAGYEFVKKGGGDAVTGKICASVACHGYPAGTATMPAR